MLTLNYDTINKKYHTDGKFPPKIVNLNQTQNFIIAFHDNCRYSYGYQHEFNKLWNTVPFLSVKTSFIPLNNANSIHICWRYNSDTLELEVAPIYIVNGVTQFPDNTDLLTCQPNQKISIRIEIDKEKKISTTTLKNKSTGESTVTKSDFFENGLFGYGLRSKPFTDADFPHNYSIDYYYV